MSYETVQSSPGAVVDLPRVLVVDDDTDMREMMRLFLEIQSMETDEAEDGTDALRKFDATVHNAVLLDLMMPNMNGYDVMSELAARDPALLRRIIVVSGGGTDMNRNIDSRVFDIVNKPFSPAVLVQRVRDCLAQSHVLH